MNHARSKGVGILIWVHPRDVDIEAKMRPLFNLWAGWGVKGVKIDFFENDSHETMQLYETLARVANEYKLVVNFRGTTKPNGLGRKWPKVLSHESVFGAEQGGVTAEHNVSLVFTRNAVGPMDSTRLSPAQGRAATARRGRTRPPWPCCTARTSSTSPTTGARTATTSPGTSCARCPWSGSRPACWRGVRLNVRTGAQNGEPNVARIYELEVYGKGQFNTNAY